MKLTNKANSVLSLCEILDGNIDIKKAVQEKTKSIRGKHAWRKHRENFMKGIRRYYRRYNNTTLIDHMKNGLKRSLREGRMNCPKPYFKPLFESVLIDEQTSAFIQEVVSPANGAINSEKRQQLVFLLEALSDEKMHH